MASNFPPGQDDIDDYPELRGDETCPNCGELLVAIGECANCGDISECIPEEEGEYDD